MKIAVIDYGIGNLRSAEKALQHVGADARLTSDAGEIDAAAGVVLPGVGAFGACAAALRRAGLEAACQKAIEKGKPFLGVCVGFQLLYAGSEESPGVPGLGIFDGVVGWLPDDVRRPQMQWNRLETVDDRAEVLLGTGDAPWMYFVHSLAPPVGEETVAVCDYGGPVAAAVAVGTLWGTQFHPEKSGEAGLGLLGRFAAAVDGCVAA